ncbi:hypothetical protein ABPG74_008094 [Tetrahymena malaccensis]
MYDINLAFLIPLISSFSFYYFCQGIKNQNQQKKIDLFQLFAAIVHFVSYILLNRVIDQLHPNQEYLITLLQLFPLVCFCIYNYIMIKSLFLSICFCLLQLVHFDSSLFSIYIYPENDLILQVGSRFFFVQNTMLFFMKLYTTTVYVGLWLNNSEKHIFKFSIFALALCSCIIFIYQQYKNYVNSQFLDIFTCKKLKKLINLDKQRKLQKTLQNVKRIYLCFQCDEVSQEDQKFLIQACFYNFGYCEIFSNFITRLFVQELGFHQKVEIMKSTLIDKLKVSIIKGSFAPLIKETDVKVYGKHANELALTFAKSGNFIKFDLCCDEEQYHRVKFALQYLNLVDKYQSNFLSVLAYQKCIKEYMLNNPNLVLYDLFD